MEFVTETSLPAERVIGLLTDFSERRPERWPGLWEGAYKVYSVGDRTAEVQEGNRSPRVWARERYDWSRPGVVRWEVVEKNFCKPGSFVEARLQPADDGGTRINVTWSREGTSLSGRIAAVLIPLMRGGPVKASLRAGLKKEEERSA